MCRQMLVPPRWSWNAFISIQCSYWITFLWYYYRPEPQKVKLYINRMTVSVHRPTDSLTLPRVNVNTKIKLCSPPKERSVKAFGWPACWAQCCQFPSQYRGPMEATVWTETRPFDMFLSVLPLGDTFPFYSLCRLTARGRADTWFTPIFRFLFFARGYRENARCRQLCADNCVLPNRFLRTYPKCFLVVIAVKIPQKTFDR